MEVVDVEVEENLVISSVRLGSEENLVRPVIPPLHYSPLWRRLWPASNQQGQLTLPADGGQARRPWEE